jgi:hypothetical protein
MKMREDDIERVLSLSGSERAAAIMHYIYIETIENPSVDWSTTLPSTWNGLDERAKQFNRAILDTWRKYPELLAAWTDYFSIRNQHGGHDTINVMRPATALN